MSHEDELWERTADYGWFAEHYQWTPEQVDRLPLWYRDRLPGYANLCDEVRDEKSKPA